jgi:hypothetical protein
MTTGTYWTIAPAVQINWRAVDQDLTRTATSLTTPSVSQGNSTTSLASATARTTPFTSGQSGFSAPQVVGIAVGAVLGPLALAALPLLAWFVIRHLQRRKRTVHNLTDGRGTDEDKRVASAQGQLEAQEIDALNEVHEKPGDELPPPVYKLPSPPSPVELDGAVLSEMENKICEASRRRSGVDEETVLGGWL